MKHQPKTPSCKKDSYDIFKLWFGTIAATLCLLTSGAMIGENKAGLLSTIIAMVGTSMIAWVGIKEVRS